MLLQTRYLLSSLKSIFNVALQIKATGTKFAMELPLHTKSEINADKYEGLWNLNPTLEVHESGFSLYCRSTNARFIPSANLKGEMKLEKIGTGVRNQTFKLLVNREFEIQDQEIIISLESKQSFEDPRFVADDETRLLIGTVVVGDPEVSNVAWETKVGIYDIGTDKLSLIKSPINRRFEKNWVPISVANGVVKILHSNNPQIILDVNSHNGEILDVQYGKASNFLSLNGGSQFLSIQEENLYIRVARKRYTFWRLGTIHLNYLLIHDSNLEEVHCSRPFIFSKFGFEICNGLGVDPDGKLVFSWGEDDSRMFVGSMPLNQALAWIESNSFNKGKFANMRVIFRFLKLASIASKKYSPSGIV